MSTIEFTVAIGKFEKGLRDFAMKLTKDKTDASDLYQETAYRAFKSFHQFNPNTNLRAWLMTIMRNIFINTYRKKRRRQTYQDGSANNYLIDSTANTVANTGVMKMDYDELLSLVNRLPKHLKIPFLMVYQGYKYQEIAEAQQVPIGTVKSRVFMARRQVQQLIQKYYGITKREELSAA